MAYATLRFYAELNDFLPAQRRQRDWTLAFEPPAPARHLIETCGVPHTEVELILREGASIGLETPVGDGDRLAVYPMFESCDVRPLLRLRPRPLRRLRFLADAHLGALARRLRMLGFDTIWHNDLGDGPLARLAVLEHRNPAHPRPPTPVAPGADPWLLRPLRLLPHSARRVGPPARSLRRDRAIHPLHGMQRDPDGRGPGRRPI